MSSIQLPPIAGIDIGRSAVKISLIKDGNLYQHQLRTCICPAKEIDDVEERARAEAESVILGNTKYWVGETAYVHRGSHVGLNDDWITSKFHEVLVLFADKWLKTHHGVDIGSGITRVVMGLPSKAMGDQKEALVASVKKLLPECKLTVIPQPNGPFYDLMLLDSGMPNTQHSLANESWAVVDVGYQTTDMTLMRAGARFVADAAGSCSGINKASEHLLSALQTKRGFSKLRLIDVDSAFRVGTVKYNAKIEQVGEEAKAAQTVLVTEIIDKAQQLFAEDAHLLDGILVSGGGAEVVFPQIREAWSHAVMAEKPRLSISRGFARYGAMLEMLAAMQKPRQAA